MKVEPKLVVDATQVEAIGEAMKTPVFRMLYDMIAAYEQRILVLGIDDEAMSKDYLRGFVHGVRALRADMQTAYEYVVNRDRVAEAEKLQKERPQSPFMPPGRGPGGLS